MFLNLSGGQAVPNAPVQHTAQHITQHTHSTNVQATLDEVRASKADLEGKLAAAATDAQQLREAAESDKASHSAELAALQEKVCVWLLLFYVCLGVCVCTVGGTQGRCRY